MGKIILLSDGQCDDPECISLAHGEMGRYRSAWQVPMHAAYVRRLLLDFSTRIGWGEYPPCRAPRSPSQLHCVDSSMPMLVPSKVGKPS